MDSFSRKSVRFVAGQFADKIDQFLVALRAAVQVRPCATVDFRQDAYSHEASAMFILGPVGHVKGAGHAVTRGHGARSSESNALLRDCIDEVAKRPPRTGPERSDDKSRGWPTIQSTKEKPPQHVSEHTKKFVIYFGSNASRRAQGNAQRREGAREQRAEKSYEKTGWQPHWRK